MQFEKAAGTFYGIELLRGLAAIAVLIYHVSRHFEQNFGFFPLTRVTEVGYTGVDFFFVLSGFIIAYVHRADIGRPAALGRYLRQRFTRIYPFYWLVLAVAMGLVIAGAHHALPAVPDLIRNLLLLPLAKPLVGVSWSLQHEVVFYFLFAVVIIDRRLGSILLTVWLGANLLLVYVPVHPLLENAVISKHNSAFFIGIGAAWLVVRQVFFAPRTALAAGLAIFAAVIVVELAGGLTAYSIYGRLYYALGAGLIIIGCVQYEARYGLPRPWLGRILGRSSYSIYLTHPLVSGLFYKIFASLGLLAILPVRLSAVLLMVITIIVACLLSTWVEIPLMRLLRRRLAGVGGA